jgi:Holliday junction resolvase
VNSRNKGKTGELEFAALLRSRGYATARRGQQFRGGGDSPDVVGVAGVHHEVKRTERLSLYDAVDQARRDAASGGDMPVVAHRCNSKPRSCRGDWLFVLGADDYFRLLKAAGYDG